MSKKLKFISNYIGNLIKNYQKLKLDHNLNTYRIVDMSIDKDGKNVLTIHLRGKPVTFKISPMKIMENDNLLQSFSKQDIRTITYLAHNEPKSSAKIAFQEFSETQNKMIFGIRQANKVEIVKLTAEEILGNAELIKTLSAIEAYKIGFIAAEESSSNEKELINHLKNKKLS